LKMAGKGPAPLKPRDNKRRQNATPGFKILSHDAREGKDTPPWPLPSPEDDGVAAAEAAEWSRLWSLPQAEEWERMRCEPTVALYVRVFVRASMTGGDPKLLNEFRQLDSKIGISPRAMLDLRWETDNAPELAPELLEVEVYGSDERVFIPKG